VLGAFPLRLAIAAAAAVAVACLLTADVLAAGNGRAENVCEKVPPGHRALFYPVAVPTKLQDVVRICADPARIMVNVTNISSTVVLHVVPSLWSQARAPVGFDRVGRFGYVGNAVVAAVPGGCLGADCTLPPGSKLSFVSASSSPLSLDYDVDNASTIVAQAVHFFASSVQARNTPDAVNKIVGCAQDVRYAYQQSQRSFAVLSATAVHAAITVVSGYENCHPLIAAVRGADTESRVATIFDRLRIGSWLKAAREIEPLLQHLHI
jgi:hypothetical protein